MNIKLYKYFLPIILYMAVGFNIAAHAAQKDALESSEHIQVSLIGEWDTDHALTAYIKDLIILKEVVPKGQYIDYWNRYYQETIFLKTLKEKSRKQFLKELLQQKKTIDKNLYWNIIAELPDRTIYEWKTNNNIFFSDQHEIAAIIDGNINRWDIAYVELGNGLSEETRNHWIKTFTEAQIVSE